MFAPDMEPKTRPEIETIKHLPGGPMRIAESLQNQQDSHF